MAPATSPLYHRQSPRYLHVTGEHSLVLRLRVRLPAVPECLVHYRVNQGWSCAKLYPYATTARHVYFQGHLEGVPGLLQYYFQAQYSDGVSLYLGREATPAAAGVTPFEHRWQPETVFRTPDWVKDAVFYQIFPDRFANGDTTNDPVVTQPWGAKPTRTDFFGGDLEGIRKNISYLQDLGVNAVWLNPVFAAPSNHRYDTTDYLTIDPLLGDKATFRRLLRELHAAGIRLILDGVFNHTSSRFWAFEDIRERGASSPYLDWYYVFDLPIRQEPEPSYACWWNFHDLPKLRETNPLVRRYLLGVAQYWTSYGIDGWRLDVPNEIKGDFWVEFRRLIKAQNPEAYLTGEIWGDGRPWLRGDQFDAVMNYLFRDLVLDFFLREKIDLAAFDRLLGLLRLRYPEQVNYCLLNLLGSHDTPRLFTESERALAGKSPNRLEPRDITRRLRPPVIFQMTYVGAPMIYYGDEAGLPGAEDPDCRRCLPWAAGQRDRELFGLYRRLVWLRRRYGALRRGTFETLLTDDSRRLYAYRRRWQSQTLTIVLNAGPGEQSARIPVDGTGPYSDLLQNQAVPVAAGQLALQLGPYSGAILAPDALKDTPDC